MDWDDDDDQDQRRARRRDDQHRVKERSKRRLHKYGIDDNPRMVGKHANSHDALCSCNMCRNPRHSTLCRGKAGLTRQELIEDSRWREMDD